MEPITVARKPLCGTVAETVLAHGTGALNIDGCRIGTEQRFNPPTRKSATVALGSSDNCNGVGTMASGRWPANLIHDGGEDVLALLGSAARFFYAPKASKRDRDEGLDGFPLRDGGHYAQDEWSRQNMGGTPDSRREQRRNAHPTVKPTDLMRHLCRLVTPPGGTVLDPFMGSGSTGKAAMLEGFRFVGIERDEEYLKIAEARIAHAARQERIPLE